ncbi:MarR family winged helix-turn-helix transcriptional regulator [Pseudonocardia sp. GCM10023141]|uniref:MarR family winged helix-turn-helix transcriptional regulator n=1 Tax=Pseudonocardia sp. GCM10023141 TaxID=3252653 RepID=UPI0036243939
MPRATISRDPDPRIAATGADMDYSDDQLMAVADARYLMRRAFRMIDTEARKVELDPLAFQALVQLIGIPARTRQVGELAVRLDIPAGLVSRLIKDLEAVGYVARLPSPEDKRVTLVRITEPGEKLVLDLYGRVREKFRTLTDDLDEERRVRALAVWADNFSVSLSTVLERS